MRVNGRWHDVMPITKTKTIDDKIKWHIVHHSTCGCYPIPHMIKMIMKKRKIPAAF